MTHVELTPNAARRRVFPAPRHSARGMRAMFAPLMAGLMLAGIAQGQPPPLTATLDVLFLAPHGPVSVRLVCIRERRDDADSQMLASTLFRLLDADADRRLDPEEAARIPDGRDLAAGGRIGDDWTQLDRSPADDAISQDELRAYVDRMESLDIRLVVGTSERIQRLDLYRRLDTDRDAHISIDELRAAPAALRSCDFDNDESFSLPELEALTRAAASDRGTKQSEDTRPFVALRQARFEESILRSAAYATPTGSPSAETDSSETAAKSAVALLRRLDRDHDGQVSVAELLEMQVDFHPRLECEARFADRGAVGINLRDPTGEGAAALSDLRRRKMVEIEGVPVQLRLQNSQIVTPLLQKYYTEQFPIADANKNGYVEPAEFPQLDLGDRRFAAVDLNQNGEIVADELRVYVGLEILISRNTLLVAVDRERKSLFELLDADSDRRLTARELLSGAERLAALDADGDTQLADGELSDRYGLTFSLGAPQLSPQFARRVAAAGRSTSQMPLPGTATQGPLWFRRMDRNRDGDVSWREFLGPKPRFDELDADNDGLLSVAEARRAGAGAGAGD